MPRSWQTISNKHPRTKIARDGFIGANDCGGHTRELLDPSATTNERTWAYKLGDALSVLCMGASRFGKIGIRKPLRRGKERHNIIKRRNNG